MNRKAWPSRANITAAPAPKPQIQMDVKTNLQKKLKSEVISSLFATTWLR